MIRNKTIVFLATVPWSYSWQRQHEWASRLAKNNKVLYLAPFGMNNYGPIKFVKKLKARKQSQGYEHDLPDNIEKNIKHLSLKFIPQHDRAWLNSLNAQWIAKQLQPYLPKNERDIVFWVCNPADTMVALIKRFPQSIKLYDIAMRFLKRPDAPAYLKSSQDELARTVDFIITDSRASATDMPSEAQHKISYVPQGVNESLLIRKEIEESSSKIKKIPKPRIIYLGAGHDSLDIPLMRSIVDHIPQAQLVLVGLFEEIPAALKHPRIHYLGPTDFGELPAILPFGDVGIIPYLINDYTAGVFPTKLFEYAAAGLPVITTDLPEMRQFSSKLLIAKSQAKFVEKIKHALAEKNVLPDQTFLSDQSWAKRFEKIEKIFATIQDNRS